MQLWLKISLLLCAYGFFREMRPSEPFVYEFLTNYRNLTEEQVIGTIYPMGTYWNFGLLVIVFLLTDMLRYKLVIIVSACAGAALFICLAWTKTIEGLFVSKEEVVIKRTQTKNLELISRSANSSTASSWPRRSPTTPIYTPKWIGSTTSR